MIVSNVNIARVSTMADGSIRLTVDLLPGSPDDFKEAFVLQKVDTRMYLGADSEFDNNMKDDYVDENDDDITG